MKTLRNPFLIVAILLYCVSKILRYFELIIPIINNYLADLVCLPIVLSLALAFQRTFILQNSNYRLRNWQIIFAFILFSVVVEGIVPLYSQKYTADGMDIIAYAAGAFVFYRWMNK